MGSSAEWSVAGLLWGDKLHMASLFSSMKLVLGVFYIWSNERKHQNQSIWLNPVSFEERGEWLKVQDNMEF